MAIIFGWDIVDSSSFVANDPNESLHAIAHLATTIRNNLAVYGAQSLQFRGDGEYFVVPSSDSGEIHEYREAIKSALQSIHVDWRIYTFVATGTIISTDVGNLSEAFWRIDRALKNPDERHQLQVEVVTLVSHE